jgi:hypothetical protein
LTEPVSKSKALLAMIKASKSPLTIRVAMDELDLTMNELGSAVRGAREIMARNGKDIKRMNGRMWITELDDHLKYKRMRKKKQRPPIDPADWEDCT